MGMNWYLGRSSMNFRRTLRQILKRHNKSTLLDVCIALSHVDACLIITDNSHLIPRQSTYKIGELVLAEQH